MAGEVVLPLTPEEVRRKYFEWDGLDWAPFAESIGLHPKYSRLDYPTMRWRQEKYEMQLLEKAEKVNHDLLEARMDTYQQAAKLIVQYPKTAEMFLGSIHNEMAKLVKQSAEKNLPLDVTKVERLARALRHVAFVHDTYVFRKLPEINMFSKDVQPRDASETANKNRIVYALRGGEEMTLEESMKMAEEWYDKPAEAPPTPPPQDKKDGSN